jgi:hypothetical protein
MKKKNRRKESRGLWGCILGIQGALLIVSGEMALAQDPSSRRAEARSCRNMIREYRRDYDELTTRLNRDSAVVERLMRSELRSHEVADVVRLSFRMSELNPERRYISPDDARRSAYETLFHETLNTYNTIVERVARAAMRRLCSSPARVEGPRQANPEGWALECVPEGGTIGSGRLQLTYASSTEGFDSSQDHYGYVNIRSCTAPDLCLERAYRLGIRNWDPRRRRVTLSRGDMTFYSWAITRQFHELNSSGHTVEPVDLPLARCMRRAPTIYDFWSFTTERDVASSDQYGAGSGGSGTSSSAGSTTQPSGANAAD